jgi:hypothetical protein
MGYDTATLHHITFRQWCNVRNITDLSGFLPSLETVLIRISDVSMQHWAVGNCPDYPVTQCHYPIKHAILTFRYI